MLSFLNQQSRQRTAWLLLMLSALSLELCALFFQHVMDLLPCVMCIYERVAMLGILIAGALGLSAPKNLYIRTTALVTWGLSTSWGLKLALEHVSYQFPDPNQLFGTVCDIFVRFPTWAPLNKWVPWMFEASGDCGKIDWQFLTLSMPQWLVIIFSAMLVVFLTVVAAQFISPKIIKKTTTE